MKDFMLGTLSGGGSAKLPLDHPTAPLQPICPGEGTIPGTVDATGVDAQFSNIVGLIASPHVSGRSTVLWALDWQVSARSSFLPRFLGQPCDAKTSHVRGALMPD